MAQGTLKLPANQITDFQHHGESVIDSIFRSGAQQMLQIMLEKEVDDFIKRHSNVVDQNGRQLIVRNGYHNERSLLSGAGMIKVKQPRVNDRRPGQKFTSAILPPYMPKH